MPKGKLTTGPGWVSLQVFDPIPTAGLAVDEAKGLAERVHRIVFEAVTGEPVPAQLACDPAEETQADGTTAPQRRQ